MVGPAVDSTKPPAPTSTIKFLCSHGGKILPRYPDGKLRYHGGETRVLAFHRSVSFAELKLKLDELCGTTVRLKCQLPSEDLDALVTITSDEDLVNIIEEYDRGSPSPSQHSLKIRAFLFLPKSANKNTKSSHSSSKSSSSSSSTSPRLPPLPKMPLYAAKSGYRCYSHGNHSLYRVHNGNYWL